MSEVFASNNVSSQGNSVDEIQSAGEQFTEMLLLPVSLGGSALAERFGGIDATRITIGAVTTVLAELIVRSIKEEHVDEALTKLTAQLRKTVEGGYQRKAEIEALSPEDRKLLTASSAGNA